jgi:hypothetical protein
MSYNLFLDDLRTIDMVYKAPYPDFIIVRSYEEFVSYITENGVPDYISFDNDLGEDKDGNLLPDGYACAKWLVHESGLDLKNLHYHVHSANPIASQQIKSLLGNYLKFLRETDT